jgi:hypothetical protein
LIIYAFLLYYLYNIYRLNVLLIVTFVIVKINVYNAVSILFWINIIQDFAFLQINIYFLMSKIILDVPFRHISQIMLIHVTNVSNFANFAKPTLNVIVALITITNMMEIACKIVLKDFIEIILINNALYV